MSRHSAPDYDLADIHEGAEFEHEYRIGDDTYAQFLGAFGDLNPLHVSDRYAIGAGFSGRVMHGAIVNGFVSHFVGMVFPGRRSLLLSVDVRYAAPSYLGDQLALRATVDRVVESQRTVLLNFVIRGPADAAVIARGRVQVKILPAAAEEAPHAGVEDAAVIVTGGTKGLGRELSLAFGRAGYEVLALYRSDAAAAQSLGAELAAAGLRGRAVQHDVTQEGFPELPACRNLVLINNAAAAFEPRPLHLLEWKDYEDALGVAVQGAFRASQALLRPMIRAGRGTIVNVLSSAIFQVPKGFGAYVPAKFALLGLTRSLAAEYSPRGLRIFSVSPGFMDTPLTRAWTPALRAASEASDVATNARAILDLVTLEHLSGQGENYPLP
jgi:NAD(P)-dependent dehydrogenase (short-subunit alcohol dehydrogenase family)/acyl dehydratase